MDKTIKSLADKFQQPLSPLFFLFGAVLILLGLTTGLDIPILKRVVTNPDYRVITLILGVVCLVASVILYRCGQEKSTRRTSPNAHSTGTIGSEIPAELILPILVRLTQITDVQRRVLRFIEVKRELSMAVLIREFSDMQGAELYYRMEQLRLLGFLTRQRLGDDESDPSTLIYRLSEEFRCAIEDMPPATASSPISSSSS